MDNNELNIDSKQASQNEVLTWQIEEYTYYERSRNWYIAATATAFFMLIFSFFNKV